MLLKSILVAVEGRAVAEPALPYAAELARTAGAALTLVLSTDAQPKLHRGLSHLHLDALRYLRDLADQLRTQGLVVDAAVAPGDGPRALMREIERCQPDLVVMSTHAALDGSECCEAALELTRTVRGGILLVPSIAPPDQVSTGLELMARLGLDHASRLMWDESEPLALVQARSAELASVDEKTLSITARA